jgi:glycosyltransferase involved in cell wall biosynthesis
LLADVDWVVVPSVWYENAPLVIQEAFQHGRPVICSDIGGMAEKVTDGVDGLHFRAGDARDLAATLQRAVTSPGLWERLSAGIQPVHDLETHVNTLQELYSRLVAERRGQRPVQPRLASVAADSVERVTSVA